MSTMTCINHPNAAEGLRRCARCGGTFCNDCLVTIQDEPFCAHCKTERLLDVRSGVGRGPLVYGGFGARAGAQVLDALIWGIPAYAIFAGVMIYLGNDIQRQELEPMLLFFGAYVPLFVFPVVYEGLLLTLKNGETVGKMAFRLRVVRPDGSRIRAGQAWGRAFLRVVLGCFLVVDYIPYFFTDEKTTLHDMVAGTRVVETRQEPARTGS